MTAHGGPLKATLTRADLAGAIRCLTSVIVSAARAEGCHAATGHFGAGNISNIVRYMGEASRHLGLAPMDPADGLAAALAREAALREALTFYAPFERNGTRFFGGDDGGKRALAALAVKP